MIHPISYTLNNNNYDKNLSFRGKYGLKAGTILGIIPSAVTAFVATAGTSSFKPLISGFLAGLFTCGVMGHFVEELTNDNNDNDNDATPPDGNLDLQG